jgi:CheY-like chemotaxis protein
LIVRTTTLDVADPEADVLEVEPGRYVVVQVADNGEGIVAETLAQVFDPFFTTKSTGKGTGLGLAMVYGFAKQSNGAVSIESSPDQGTTVTMLLPIAGEELFDARPDSAGPVTEGDHELVLLVEDEAMVRTLVSSQLVSLGYRVVEAGDAAEALAVLSAEPGIALLFTDVLLPGAMNGKALADAVHCERPDLPVLFTSGFTQHALSTDGRLAPGVRLLEKPYLRADLARALAAVLAGDDPPA